MLFGCTHDSLVPYTDAAMLVSTGKLTDKRGEDSVRVPIYQGRKIDVHIEGEGKCFFFKVAVFQELIDLTKLEVYSFFRQANRDVSQTNQMAIPYGHVIH